MDFIKKCTPRSSEGQRIATLMSIIRAETRAEKNLDSAISSYSDGKVDKKALEEVQPHLAVFLKKAFEHQQDILYMKAALSVIASLSAWTELYEEKADKLAKANKTYAAKAFYISDCVRRQKNNCSMRICEHFNRKAGCSPGKKFNDNKEHECTFLHVCFLCWSEDHGVEDKTQEGDYSDCYVCGAMDALDQGLDSLSDYLGLKEPRGRETPSFLGWNIAHKNLGMVEMRPSLRKLLLRCIDMDIVTIVEDDVDERIRSWCDISNMRYKFITKTFSEIMDDVIALGSASGTPLTNESKPENNGAISSRANETKTFSEAVNSKPSEAAREPEKKDNPRQRPVSSAAAESSGHGEFASPVHEPQQHRTWDHRRLYHMDQLQPPPMPFPGQYPCDDQMQMQMHMHNAYPHASPGYMWAQIPVSSVNMHGQN